MELLPLTPWPSAGSGPVAFPRRPRLGALSSGHLLPDPRTLPFRFEVVGEFPRTTLPVDLDGDGQDDFVWVRTFNAPPRWPTTPRHDASLLLTHRGEPIAPQHGNWLIHRFCNAAWIFLVWHNDEEVLFNHRLMLSPEVRRELAYVRRCLARLELPADHEERVQRAVGWCGGAGGAGRASDGTQ
jgi:hypothetical protein